MGIRGQTPELNTWEIVQTSPALLALTYQHYVAIADSDVVRNARALFSVAEVLVRYLTVIATAYRRGSPAPGPKVPLWAIDSLPVL